MDTMEEAFQIEKEMVLLEEEGNLKESSLLGMKIIKGFTHTPMIEKESFQCCFNEISQEDFYKHVIKTAKWIINQYK